MIGELVEKFAEHRETYRRAGYNETQLRQDFLDPFFVALGWDVFNQQGFAEAYRDVILEQGLKVEQSVRAPDYCFRIGGTPKFFVEAKKPAVDIKSDVGPAFQLRRYAWTAKLPLSILTRLRRIRRLRLPREAGQGRSGVDRPRDVFELHRVCRAVGRDRGDLFARGDSQGRVRQVCRVEQEKAGHGRGRCGVSGRNRGVARVAGEESQFAKRSD